MADEQINLRLLIDKQKNRVVFAESGSDFVDVLLSFLTLPIGTIIRLTEKKSNVGSLNTLYSSVEALDLQYLQTEACKAMLLSPRMEHVSEMKCDHLVLQVNDDKEHQDLYGCTNWTCRTKTHRLISMFKYSTCHCGIKMHEKSFLSRGYSSQVFVKGTSNRFMISDNLNVKPASTTDYLSLLSQLGISGPKDVEECNISVGMKEVVHLLKQSLVSHTPMKDIFLEKKEDPIDSAFPVMVEALDAKVKLEPLDITNKDSTCIRLKLLVSKSNNVVLYAEANEEFLDLLFSFLTFPMGSMLKLFDASFPVGSFANIYKSAKSLSTDSDVLLEECKELLLAPKIAFHYGIKKQLLNIQEGDPWQVQFNRCKACYLNNGSCSHCLETANLSITNPKFVNTITDSGGGYVKRPCTFMVTDDLHVKPFSPICCTSVVRDSGVPFSELEEKEAVVGEYEALSLLWASITSSNVLTQVFCLKKREPIDAENLECKRRTSSRKRNRRGGDQGRT